MKSIHKSLLKIALILLSFLPFCNATAQINCPAPVAGAATNITSSSATLNWTLAGTITNNSILVRYRPITVAGAPWDTVTTGGLSTNVSNLTPATPYEYQVARYCVNPNGLLLLSAWSNTVVFTTLPSSTTCPTPTGLTTTNITSNSAVLGWQPAAPNVLYNVRYRMTNTATWTTITVTINSTPLFNLSPATGYEWQVQTVCSNSAGSTTTSPFSASAFFTTLPASTPCSTPTNLSESNVTSTSATLNWNSTGASSYRIRYRISGSSTWIFKSSNTNSKAITGLTAASIYTWQVRSICTDSNNVSIKSPWSALRTFTTPSPTNCPAPTGLTVGNIFSNQAFAIWSPVPLALNYEFNYRIVTPPNPNSTWISIVTTTTNAAMQNLVSGAVYECRVRTRCGNSGTVGTYSPWSASVIFTTPSFISIFPNPATDQVTFTVTSEENSTAQLLVYDFTGNTVRTLNSNVSVGENRLNLDATSLNNGIYTYQFTQGNQTSRGKFIVKH
jgi:hypothetical protein